MDSNNLAAVVMRELQILRGYMEAGHKALDALTIQLESYVSLVSFLRPRHPFPAMDAGAVAPDFALLLSSHVIERRPEIVVELGSGVSTLVIGYLLERNGRGKLISIEHDKKYLNYALDAVRRHQLTEHVEVVYAPLTHSCIAGQPRLWYDPRFAQRFLAGSIDILLVDGPPAVVSELARYPAVPLLSEYLKKDALILVDDANRSDERQIVSRWLSECPQLEAQHVDTLKGTEVLYFSRLRDD